MRARVDAAVHETGYEPDLVAQSLRRGSTRTIGFALRDISNPLFAMIAKQCEQELRRAGYSLLLTNSDGDVGVESANIGILRRRRVDGLIVSLVSETTERTRRALADAEVPIVLIDREVDGLTVGQVLCDHGSGVKAAVADLLDAGHRRIALITGALDVRSSRERRRGYLDAYAARHIAPPEDLMLFGEFDQSFAEVSVRDVLRKPDPPTAVVTGGVLTTVGALKTLRELGLSLGSDVTVVALDGSPIFEAFDLPIGLVSRDFAEIGAAASQLMLAMLNGAPPRAVSVPTYYHPAADRPSEETDTTPSRRGPQSTRRRRTAPTQTVPGIVTKL
jgi:LacI family transcriptional regulator